MQIVTRAEAKAAGLKQYFTGKACKHGHIATRYTVKGTCAECLRITTDTWRSANPDVYKASSKASKIKLADRIRKAKREYNQRNADAIRAYRKIYNAKNAERRLASIREWREKNREHRAAYFRAWIAANPERHRAARVAAKARRRSRESVDQKDRAAIVAWVKRSPKICHWCGVRCRIGYHVDHYQPLAKGGKHSAENLVIACRKCNQRKNAKDPYEFAASVGRLF